MPLYFKGERGPQGPTGPPGIPGLQVSTRILVVHDMVYNT